MTDVFISVGRTADERQEAFVAAVFEHLRASGLNPRALGRSDWSSEQPLKFIEKLMDQCSGTVILAFERLFLTSGFEHRLSDSPVPLQECKITTPWNQIEAAMAYCRRQPLLVLVEDGLRGEGLLATGFDWWVQTVVLDSTSFESREFVGVFTDWKKRVESYGRPEDRLSSSKRDPQNASIGELLGSLRPPQLWATIVVTASILGGAFSAGHQWGPIVLNANGDVAGVLEVRYDDDKTLSALRTLADQIPPYYGDSVSGNERQPMEAFIRDFELSDHPEILRAVTALLAEVDARESPDRPKEYFFVDGSFRAKLATFLSQVKTYTETEHWEP